VRLPRGFAGRLCYGGDYNPEQWPELSWDEDVALMRECGVNLVTVGVFAWSRLEPREGEYDFGWLDRVLDRLHDGGISVALATPTASPPPWFSSAHPDALPVTREGVRLSHGSRDTYCASAPAYRSAALRIATVLAERYAAHPALALWHVHNEYGTSCYCDHVAGNFRGWLRRRYPNLDRLNEAWTAEFWGQLYHDWEHILPPRATQYLSNPAHMLDFRRFVSDELLACFREQRDALRHCTPDVPVTTNFVLGSWVTLDQWDWAREVDLVAIDHYPSSMDGLAAEEQTAFVADLARGWAGGGPWLLMEQAPAHVLAGGRMLPKRPGQLTRLSLSPVARGSVGAMFFQWRASRGGAEAFHSAMRPHAGVRSRVFQEVVELGRTLRDWSSLVGSHEQWLTGRVTAAVALVWDTQSWWALHGPGLPAPDLDYWSAVRSVHASAWRLGVTVDVIAPGADLSPYRLVLVPGLYLLAESTADTICSYVEDGGHVAVWYPTGVVDADVRVHPGGPPGPLAATLGLRVEQQRPLPPGVTVALSNGAPASRWSELLRLEGAAVVAAYAGGELDGEPAITRHAHGSGVAWYVSTHLDADAGDRFLADMLAGAEIAAEAAGAGGGVEVVRRAGNPGWLLAINHTAKPAEIVIRETGTSYMLQPGEAVLRRDPASVASPNRPPVAIH
jgi:beta-galactosidase